MAARGRACASGSACASARRGAPRSGGRSRTGLAIGAALPLAILLACGGEEAPTATTETTPPPAASATPPAATPPGAAKAPREGLSVATGELPKGYPEDLPQPPAAEPQTSMMIEGQGGLITFLSTESTESVAEHFKKSLPEQGWQVAEVSGGPARSVIKATKDSRAVDVTVGKSPKGDGTAVVVLVKEQ
jgi:hypothetical protein